MGDNELSALLRSATEEPDPELVESMLELVETERSGPRRGSVPTAGRRTKRYSWLAAAVVLAVALLGGSLALWSSDSGEVLEVEPADSAGLGERCPDRSVDPPRFDQLLNALMLIHPHQLLSVGPITSTSAEVVLGTPDGDYRLIVRDGGTDVAAGGEPVEVRMCDPFQPGGPPTDLPAIRSSLPDGGEEVVVDLGPGRWELRVGGFPGDPLEQLLEGTHFLRWPYAVAPDGAPRAQSFTVEVPKRLVPETDQPVRQPIEEFFGDLTSDGVVPVDGGPVVEPDSEVVGFRLVQDFSDDEGSGLFTVSVTPVDTMYPTRIEYLLLEHGVESPAAVSGTNPLRLVRNESGEDHKAYWLDGTNYVEFSSMFGGLTYEEFERAVDSFQVVG